ncbi:hypothetical protein [Archangium sp.]|uniref:hypothetical protein n=1 Tax=Archangium sp. TaxID=1872627 RepID=UPI002D481807|nr:hypothetical protein [Archangium sp.]HYO55902.1 hypothetical protein [Archangium sp.]
MKDNGNPFALHRDDGATRLNQIGLLLMFLPGVLGAQEAAGFSGDPEVDRRFVFALNTLGGALGGWLFGLGRAPAHAGLLGGALASTGGMVLTYFGIAERDRFFFIEAVFFWLVGSIPGALTYKTLIGRATRSRRPR